MKEEALQQGAVSTSGAGEDNGAREALLKKDALETKCGSCSRSTG